MLSSAAILVIGFFLGMRHATDPDHVIAITTIVSKQRSVATAGFIGALWGLGHTLTIFVIGVAMIVFKVVIPPRLGLSMEFAVGLMLILLGVLNLTGLLSWLQRKFTPGHDSSQWTNADGENVRTRGQDSDDAAHSRTASATPQVWLHQTFRGLGVYNILRPLVIGIVHGLAGSAAIALLVMTAIGNTRWAVAYLLLFGLGTIAGMMLITAAIAIPLEFSPQRFSKLNLQMAAASGLVSMGFGLFLSYRIGFVQGLFTSHLHWIPG